MGKKFSITKTIDLNKLNNEIDEYIMRTGKTNFNLFMHIDTVNAIDKTFSTKFVDPIHVVQGVKGAMAYWEGHPIFIDNKLEFGEVEIGQECKHEWRIVGSVAGTKAKYDVFVCPKCGKQQTRRTTFNKEGDGYIVTILDDED